MTPVDAAMVDDPELHVPTRPRATLKFRVLVADDESDVVVALRLLLGAHDIAVTAAASPQDALAVIRSQSLDAALIDLNYQSDSVPGRQGLEFIRTIVTQHPELPVVGMTTWTSVDLINEALRRGAREVIEKPWEDLRVIAIMRTQAELGRALRRVRELEAEVQRLQAGGAPKLNGATPSLKLLDAEAQLVRQAMETYRGNVSRAARALGVSRSALYRRLDRHNIES